MTSSETRRRVSVLLSAQGALLYNVTSNMKAVAVAWTEDDIDLRFVFYDEPGELDRELADEVGTLVAADFASGMVEVAISPVGASLKERPGEVWVFIRSDEEPGG